MEIPWYRQFWPWFLISLPAAVVVAGVSTVGISWRYADNLVADDYYKQGLAINRRLSEDRRAAAQRLVATLHVEHGGRIRVVLLGALAPRPDHLQLLLQHPTRRELDRHFVLSRNDAGYSVDTDDQLSGRWYTTLRSLASEDQHVWRLKGEVDFRQQSQHTLSSRRVD